MLKLRLQIIMRMILDKALLGLTKALYHEFPVYDKDGSLIGREWFGLRSGVIQYESTKGSCDDSIETEH